MHFIQDFLTRELRLCYNLRCYSRWNKRENIIITKSVTKLFSKNGVVEPTYKGHSREPENVVFMSSCPLYTG